MATAQQAVDSPVTEVAPDKLAFPIGGPTRASWREHALATVAEQRFLAIWFRSHTGEPPVVADATTTVVNRHLDAAERAAEGRHRHWATRTGARLSGADVERAMSHIDAAMVTLLRLAPPAYVRGQLPSVLVTARNHLVADDPRRQHVERLAERPGDGPLTEAERESLIATVHAARSAGRREMIRVRSFRTLVLVTALLLTLAVVAIVGLGAARPGVIPLCFNPGTAVVCPTQQASLGAVANSADPGGAGPTAADPGAAEAPGGQGAGAASAAEVDRLIRATASPWDVFVVALVGLMAAALAGAAAIRGVQGTSTPYSLPVSLALLKLPSGALTAVLGVLLMRGQFVPGLSALDTPEQIVAWAIVFGYSQQLVTRFVDQRAQTVLGSVRAGGRTPPAGQIAPKPV